MSIRIDPTLDSESAEVGLSVYITATVRLEVCGYALLFIYRYGVRTLHARPRPSGCALMQLMGILIEPEAREPDCQPYLTF